MVSAIDSFFAALPDQKRAIALRLRDIITKVHPKIEERIKWGNLTFVCNENNIASIYSLETVSYVNLAFFKATSLTDPKCLLEGTGKGMRHIKYTRKKISIKKNNILDKGNNQA